MHIYNILARFYARYVVIRHANCRCPGTIQWATSSAYFLRRFTNIQDAYYTTHVRTTVSLRHFDFYDGYTDYYLDKNAMQVRTSHCE